MSQVIGTGVVDIKASTKDFDAALAKLPDQAKRYFEAAERNVKASMEQIRRDMTAAMSAGNMPAASQFLGQLKQSEEALRKLHTEAGAMAGTLGSSMSSGGTRAAQALYQVGAAVDDLQYGFRGVLNNIPQIAIALGHAGLAGGIAIAVTAVYQLASHWDDLMRVIGMGPVKTAAEHMKELAQQTERTAAAQFEFNRAKEQETTRQAQEGARSKEEEESATKGREAMAEFGMDRLRDRVRGMGLNRADQSEIDKIDAEIGDIQGKMAAMEAQFGPAGKVAGQTMFGGKLTELQRKRQATIDQAAGSFLADVENNRKGARDQLADALAKNPGKFGQGAGALEGKLRATTPEAIKEEKARDERDTAMAEIAADDEKRAKEQGRKKEQLDREEQQNIRAQQNRFEREARSMAEGGIGEKLLRSPKANIENDVRARLKAQGKDQMEIDLMAKGIAAAIAAEMSKKIQENIGKFGGTEADARKRLLEPIEDRRAAAEERVGSAAERYQNAQERIRDIVGGKGNRQQSAFVGLSDFAKQMQTAMLNQRPEDKQKELIRAMQDATRAEKDLAMAIKNQQRVVAAAAPG